MPSSFLALLVTLLLSLPAAAQVSISIQNADLAMIPGSKRSLYATVSGTTNTTVNWTVTGGTISASQTTGAPLVVTAPASGSSCSYTANSSSPSSITSTTSVVVTATSAADSTQSVSRTIPVCNPAVVLTTFPMTRLAYRNQLVVLQSDLRGSVNTNVTWSLTTNPNNAGSITGGTGNRHAVFSASAAGTYVLTATSAADSSKTEYSTVIVTADPLPATPNADHTEATACSGYSAPGTTYEVGPARAYTDLNQVPWTSVTYGDLVRIHNDDTTGSSPTTYHQYVYLPGPATAQTGHVQPIVICGVPDSAGNKPVIDGSNATVRSDANTAGGNLYYGLFTLYDSPHKVDAAQDAIHNVIISGLKFVNADISHSFYKQGSSTLTAWSGFTACIRTQNGWQVSIIGNDIGNCDQGVFTNSVTPLGGMAQDMTVEGNYVHGWGSTSQGSHGLYLQAIGLQAQFNYFGASASNAAGNLLKSRSVLNFLRWNYFDTLAVNARAFDLIEPQAFNCYVIPGEFGRAFHGSTYSTDCGTPGYNIANDTTTADQVAANNEAYHSDFVYGNVIKDEGSGSAVVHYGYDQQTTTGPLFDRRGGTLYYYANTFLGTGSSKGAMDMVAPDDPTSGEYPVALGLNNIWGGAASFYMTGTFWPQITTDTSWVTAISLPYHTANDQYQGGTPSTVTGCDQYGACNSDNGHLLWARGGVLSTQAATLYTGAAPISSANYAPTSASHGLAAALPAAIANQPSNMEYYPATNTIALKQDYTYLGALEGVPTTVQSIALSPSVSVITYNGTQAYTCTTTLSDGSTRACTSPTLSSSNTSIATVSGLTATPSSFLGGVVTITVTAEGMTSTATLTITPPIPFFGGWLFPTGRL